MKISYHISPRLATGNLQPEKSPKRCPQRPGPGENSQFMAQTGRFPAIHGVFKQRLPVDGGKIAAARVGVRVLPLDPSQQILQLQHDRRLVLAAAAAEAGADQTADFSVFPGKLHLIGSRALHKGVPPPGRPG